jgi:hypothetical protein
MGKMGSSRGGGDVELRFGERGERAGSGGAGSGNWGLGIGDWGLGIGDWGLGISAAFQTQVPLSDRFWIQRLGAAGKPIPNT